MRGFAALVSLSLLALEARGAVGDPITNLPAPGRTSTGLCFDGARLWVADHGLDELIAIDRDGAPKVRLKSPGYRPAGLAFDSEQLWNVDVKEARLYRLRREDGLVTRSVPSPVAQPRSLAWDGKALWLSDDATRRLHRVDPLDGTTLRELPFPSGSVDGLTFDGRYLWVADRLDDMLYAVDPGQGEVLVALRAPGPHTTGLAFDGERLWAVDYQTDRIVSLQIDGPEPVLRTDPREAWVVYTYQLRNFGPDPLKTADVYLAKPRNLANQELLSEPLFEPKGAAIERDAFGQPAAHFAFRDISAGGVAEARMLVRMRAYQVQHLVYPHKVQPLARIGAEIRREYLKDAPKFDLENPIIQAAVRAAVGSEQNPYWIARRIYRYVHEHMRYEMVGGWDVAPQVLARGTGSCSEYSFVFIALCRSAGLPARYVGALVIRRDDASYDDVFHRWVEVYLPPYGWIPVDPSRGDKDTEAQRGRAFGSLTNDLLITTEGGGGSSLLDWTYNGNHRYTCAGRCKVGEETIAEWSPEDPRALSPNPPKAKAPPENPLQGADRCE